MKVIDICAISTEESQIIVKGNNLKNLKYTVPTRIKDADKEIMDMEVKVIEVQFNILILHVGDIEFL